MNDLIKRLEANDPNTVVCKLKDVSNPDIIARVAEALENNCFVQEVAILNTHASDTLIHAIKTLQNVTSLTISQAQLSVATVRLLSEVSSVLFETLDLSNNPKLGPRGSKLLADMVMKARALHLLNLSNAGMGNFGAEAFAAHLPNTLHTLNLSRNKLGHDGLWKIAEHFPASLEVLDLSYNKCIDDGCLQVAKYLQKMKNLKILNLAGNDIGDTGMENLASSLVGSSVEELYMQENKIGDLGMVALAKYALSRGGMEESDNEEQEENESEDGSEDSEDEDSCIDESSIEPVSALCLLDLSSNQIGSLGCTAVARALSKGCHKVETLVLSKNEIGDEGAGAFVELLDEIPSLKSLDLAGNPFSEARTRILDMLLKHRTPRESLGQVKVHDSSERSNNSKSPPDESKSSSAQEASIEECPDVSIDFDSSRETLKEAIESLDNAKILPGDYCAYLADRFISRRVLEYGAFGPLYHLTDHGHFESGLVGRKLALGPAGALQSTRESVIDEMVNLRNETIVPVAAFSWLESSNLFVYYVGDMKRLVDLLRDKDERRRLNWKSRVNVLHCVARALEYTHTEKHGHAAMFHGDVCPHNIWIATDLSSAQLLGVGMSRVIATDRMRFMSGDVVFGSRSYRCPRYERGSCPYNSASDLFSFGILIGELVTGKLQLSKGEAGMAVDSYYDVFMTGKVIPLDPLIPSAPKKQLEALCAIASSCMTPVVAKRPSAAMVEQVLSQIVNTAG